MIHLSLLLALFTPSLPSTQDGWHEVAVDDGGTDATPHLVRGDAYTFPESAVAGTDSERTCSFGDPVAFGYAGLVPEARYAVSLILASDGERLQQLEVNGTAVGEPLRLAAGEITAQRFPLPPELYSGGEVWVALRRLQGPNAVVSRISILSTDPTPLRPRDAKSYGPGGYAVVPPSLEKVNGLLPTYRPIPSSTEQSGRPEESLNGTWRAHPVPLEGYYDHPDTPVAWFDFEVPGQFAQHGIEFDPTETVTCHRTFEVEPSWRGGRVILRFEAVFSSARVYVNGTRCGEHLGGMTPFELDVTEHVTEGENHLLLEVTSWSDADQLGSLSQYTAHPLGGILRDVTLFTVPAVHLSDLRIVTDLDEAYEDATLELELELRNDSDELASGLSLGVLIHETPIDEEPDLPAVPAHSSTRVRLTLEVPSPVLWDPEHPKMYYLQLFLASEGIELESFAVPVGFREVEVLGEELLINGRPVKLRGVNRHVVDPLRGRVSTRDTAIQDALLFREANCNFIRTSHYPPSADFLMACDFVGLLVEVEAPLCWIGHGANKYWGTEPHADPKWLDYQLQANLETVHFHRNHPSVIAWSLANESAWSRNFAEVLAAVKVADPSRPQAFHDQAWGGFNNGGSNAPIANLHYPGPGGPAHVGAGSFGRPMLFGEYCHLSVYNRRETITDPSVRDRWGLGLRPMWEEMYTTWGVLGGALWSGIDDVFHLPDGTTVGYGPWGLIDGWRRKKPEFLQVRNAYSPIRVVSSRPAEGGGRLVELENRFHFTNLDEVKILWQSEDDEQQLYGPDIGPGEFGSVLLEAPGEGPLLLTFFDPREVTVAEVFVDLPEPAAAPPLTEAALLLSYEAPEPGEDLVVRAGDLELVLDAATHRIARLSRAGRTLLVGGPHLLAIQLTSDRCAPEHQPALPPLTEVCTGWRPGGVHVQPGQQEVSIRVDGEYEQAKGSFTLRLDWTGAFHVEYDFELGVDELTPRQLGVVFDLPRELDRLQWLRRAEWSNYPEDHIGRPRGFSPAFYDDCPEPVPSSTRPEWPWSHDATPLGCNDFRATRANVFRFELYDGVGRAVELLGNGEGHARAWIHDARTIRLLAATLAVPTGEMFARSHFVGVTRKLERGARIAGSVELRFL